jgi:hypothetical protein
LQYPPEKVYFRPYSVMTDGAGSGPQPAGILAWCGCLIASLDLDGRERIAASAAGPREGPDDLGRRVARDLRALGVERLLRPLRRS